MKKILFLGLISSFLFLEVTAYAEKCSPSQGPFLELEEQAFNWVKPFIKDLSIEEATEVLIQYYLDKEDSDPDDLNKLLEWTKNQYPQIYKNIVKTLLEKEDPAPLNPKMIQFKTIAIQHANEFGEEFYPLLKNRLDGYTPKFFSPYLHAVETRELQELVIALSSHEGSAELGHAILEDRYNGPKTFEPATQRNLKAQLSHLWLKSQIVESLAHLPSQKEFVMTYLNGDNIHLKVGAIRGLGNNSQNWPLLRPFLDSSDIDIKITSAGALKNDVESWPRIISLLSTPHKRLQDEVTTTLYTSTLSPQQSSPHLLEILRASFQLFPDAQDDFSFNHHRQQWFVLRQLRQLDSIQEDNLRLALSLEEELSKHPSPNNDVTLELLKRELKRFH
ncbi:MAG: hypothetical protein A2Z91_00990 [Deltaproteobacteria bacterium GWA2_38_16]|nr:MAG: hypothetical protein A2Z91_00990 [Deltaproteobacteria bacterium GWA2_38_16]OGQ02982.1 MAG: hypothetical protein A3D19_01040 [Deltaproteobacteria bacterium RIFCSPHIGHO2_02_FULL_38_15]OGQ34523.1 MAG: hypothetical protein A3A72_05180 [Deltaproteobacteria bacterium RIFCSPLOWO2_01_FULL_38_9]OGQ59225.1 MAG: hypothetical protein A3G92_06915 [Deltaproteobacteria bacterium RIFCSPLOWO2_12_FULL_38_8]HBQ21917.1 hypothetical protein [Deltaproteobacteria bacterium]